MDTNYVPGISGPRWASRRMSRVRPPHLIIFVLAIALVAAVACGSDDPAPAAAPVATPTLEAAFESVAPDAPDATETTPSGDQSSDAVALDTGTGLLYGEPGYDFTAASFNSYWYSRYTLGNLVMMSGLGVAFQPPMEAVMGMAAMVDQGPADGEHVMMPANAALLRAVYAGGDPQFIAPFNGDPMDLSNFRWDPEKMDTRLTPAAQAQTIIKEIEWAKFFNNPGWAGAPDADFGAMDRFKGMVMYAGAAQQIMFALEQLRNEDGLFVAASRFVDGAAEVIDPAVIPADQYQMLQALSDFRLLLQHADDYNGVYTNPDLLGMIGMEADALLGKIRDLEPTGIRDLGIGAQAMAWYAASAEDPALQRQALEMLAEYGDALVASKTNGVIDSARSVRGLLEAARVLGDEKYGDAALIELEVVLNAYDRATGRIDGVPEIKDWEVGDILGALNSAANNGGSGVDTEQIQDVYAGLFESLVSIGGLIQARVPVAMEVSPFELERIGKDIFFAHPSVPTPDQAGGAYGTAAVHASEFRFDEESGRWVVTNGRFDTAGAMHTSNEMMWTFGLVNAFPEVDVSTVSDFPEVQLETSQGS